MKVQAEIVSTPQEARGFLGLPDVAPMQQALMDRMQEQVLAVANAASRAKLPRLFTPGDAASSGSGGG